MLLEFPRADAHIHLFRSGFRDPGLPGGDLAAYERLRREAGIGRALVVGYEGEPRFHGNNDDILTLGERHDWITPLAYLPPHEQPRRGTLTAARRRGFHGFALYLAESGPGIDDWSPDALAELAADGAIVSVNASPAALARQGAALARLEGARVLVSHLGNPGPGAGDEAMLDALLAPLIALAAHPRIGVKISGLYAIDPRYPHARARPAALRVLDAFGPGRLVWGSDFSPALDAVDAHDLAAPPPWLLESLGADSAAVLGGNLLRLLGGSEPVPDRLRTAGD